MKKAFSMLELVFVIVVIGIIAAAIVPSTTTNNVSKAAVKLASDIRYAQHLAMIDDKFDSNDADWYKNRWQIRFSGNTYAIVSDDGNRFAVDPMDRNKTMNIIDLNDEYSTTLAFSGSCASNQIISFDHLGRPMVGNLNDDTSAYMDGQLIKDTCIIKLINGSESVIINLMRETGYAQVVYN